MNRENIAQYRMNRLLANHEIYDFPEFISLIRQQHGVNRCHASDEMGIAPMRLFYLEAGKFKRKPKLHELKLLSNYYGIELSILLHKVDNFLCHRLALAS